MIENNEEQDIIPENEEFLDNTENTTDGSPKKSLLSAMFQNYFLDYASYVILERAVPSIEDGLKPVQRRILHAMFDMDDGRYNKVANIIGQTMQYHPHGDASIGDALVNLGQKNLLIDTQGNWGDIRTGDSAAAARYIEARLSKFALEVAFNPKTTKYQASYDGRKNEPITLPMKFPLLLAQGVEGIAVGLATKILPHNFIELIHASIDILNDKTVKIYPDFPTGGLIDITHYNGGGRTGKVRVRAKIEQLDKKTLVIKDIPFGTTTSSLIESIVKANDKGKIKIKKITDNTAKDVEITIELQPGISPDVTIDALYAFTDCEVSISPNACIIIEDKPHFLTVEEILKICTDYTRSLLCRELEIELAELAEKWHFASLEKIFIEKRIYRKIEECETWEAVISTIHTGLLPHIKKFYRPVTDEDVARLTEIKIKRISKYNSFEADNHIAELEKDKTQAEYHLKHLTAYTIQYFERLLHKYGKGKERKTEIVKFDTINTTQVVAKNSKLYANMEEGFIGFGLKKDSFIEDCSDIDDIIVFRADGKFLVTKISEKAFVGKNLLHVAVWIKGDDRTTYNFAYTDGATGITYAKRFQVDAVTRDKEYDLTKGSPLSKVHYFSVNPNGEAETVTIQLSPGCSAKNKIFDFAFSELSIKGRNSLGNIITKHPVRKIKLKEKGGSTLGGRKIWFDEITGRLNTGGYGRLLGEFDNGNQLLVMYNDGSYELTNYEITNRYEIKDLVKIEKYEADTVITAVYFDGERNATYIKRFRIETSTQNQRFNFIGAAENQKAKYLFATTTPEPRIEYKLKLKSKIVAGELNLAEFVDVKGWKAIGNKFSEQQLLSVQEIEPVIPETSVLTVGDSIDFDVKITTIPKKDLFD